MTLSTRLISALGLAAIVLSSCTTVPLSEVPAPESPPAKDAPTEDITAIVPDPEETPSDAIQAPVSAEELEQLLETGALNDEAICPSADVTASNESITVAYFKTTTYWVYICRDRQNALYYHGQKRDQPEVSITLNTYPEPEGIFVASNGNTTYQVDSEALLVFRHGQVIISEPVLDWQSRLPEDLSYRNVQK